MFGVFCFVTLFSTTIASTVFNFERSNNQTINYLKILFIIIFLLFSVFNILIGIYWIFDLNNDWSSLIKSGFDRFSSNNPSIKSPPVIHYLIYIIPYVFLVCGFFCTLDFFKNLKNILVK
jgi:high-affinity Fe2+/Pb2+ permease